MATPITADDIATLFGRELTSDEEAQVTLLIEFAEAEIEEWLHRPIRITEYEENCFPDAQGAIYFKNTPVVSVEELTVNDEVKNTDYYTLTLYGLENVWEMSYDDLTVSNTEVDTDYIYGPTVVVTYTAGLDYPSAIRGLVASAVLNKFRFNAAENARAESGLGNVKQIKVEDFSQTFENSSPGSTTTSSTLTMFPDPDVDLKALRHLRKIGVR